MAPVIPLILLATAAASVGTAAYEMTNQPSAPKLPDTTAQQAQAAQAAALAQAQALTKSRGMASTILTGPTGQTTQPNVGRATLGA